MATPAATVAALVEYFKRTYSLPERTNMSIRRTPTLNRMNKDMQKLATGEAFYETMDVFKGTSFAHQFQYGMSDYAPSKGFRWLVIAPVTGYARITLDGLMMAQAPLGALLDLKSKEADSVTSNMLENVERELWGDQASDMGQVSGSGLGGTASVRILTLAVWETGYNFQNGQFLQANPTRTGSSGTLRTDIYQVTGVNYDNAGVAVVTATRVFGAASDWAASDYLYLRGCYDGGIPGIPSFIPSTDPSATLFLGVDRSNYPNHLAGWRYAFQGSIEETIKYAFSRMGRFINKPAQKYSICVSTADWLTLEQEMVGRVIRDPVAEQTFGTSSLVVRTPFGDVPVISIPVLKSGRGYIIDWTTWTFHHLKGIPHVIDDDGNVALRLGPDPSTGGGDGIEIRFRIWYHPTCTYPIANATFATA